MARLGMGAGGCMPASGPFDASCGLGCFALGVGAEGWSAITGVRCVLDLKARVATMTAAASASAQGAMLQRHHARCGARPRSACRLARIRFSNPARGSTDVYFLSAE